MLLGSRHSATYIPLGGIALIGAGSLSQQLAQYLTQNEPGVLIGFFDDTKPTGSNTPYGPILGPLSSIVTSFKEGKFGALMMGIGYNHLALRQQLFEELSVQGVPFATWVHPSAIIDVSVRLGSGCIVLASCILDLNVVAGDNVFMYPGCIVAHDTYLGSHNFLAPGVKLAGHVQLTNRCFLGIGTTVSNHMMISSDIITGAGTVVVTNLIDSGVYVGVPSRYVSIKK